MIFPVEHRDQRILCVGIIAPMRIAHAAVRIVQHWIQSLLQQSELAESETRFRDIAESASDWIWEMDAGLRFTYLSDRFFEIFKIPREHIIGKSRAEFASSNSNDPGMLGSTMQLWQHDCRSGTTHTSMKEFWPTLLDKD